MRDKSTGKSKKKLIIVIVIIAAVVAAGLFGLSRLQAMVSQPRVGSVDISETVTLSKTSLESKVTASGNLASTDPVTVGSNVEMGEVETVFVEAGDQVYAGDTLAQMKTSDLQRSISDTSSAISDAQASDARSLAAAQRAFNDADANYYANLDRNTKAVESAQEALSEANEAQDKAHAALGPNPDQASPELRKDHEEKKQAAVAAQDVVAKAQQQLEDQKRNDNSAWYNAKDQLDALQGKDSAKQQRSTLESLNEDLSNASIVSPITGIVTKVNTENGKAVSGDMFTVEDTASLGITASVAEYNIIHIEKGMKAYVTSNATDEQIYEGTVDYVAPIAADVNGNFEVRVLLTGEIGSLKPGMTATVEIVIASKENIFAVPIDAVVTTPDGHKAVYAYEGGGMTISGGSGAPAAGGEPAAGGSGSVTDGNRREIEVETGMETDYYIEISSDELTEGMLILSDPQGRNVPTGGMSPFMMGGGAGGGVVVSSEAGPGGPPAGGGAYSAAE